MTETITTEQTPTITTVAQGRHAAKATLGKAYNMLTESIDPESPDYAASVATTALTGEVVRRLQGRFGMDKDTQVLNLAVAANLTQYAASTIMAPIMSDVSDEVAALLGEAIEQIEDARTLAAGRDFEAYLAEKRPSSVEEDDEFDEDYTYTDDEDY